MQSKRREAFANEGSQAQEVRRLSTLSTEQLQQQGGAAMPTPRHALLLALLHAPVYQSGRQKPVTQSQLRSARFAKRASRREMGAAPLNLTRSNTHQSHHRPPRHADQPEL